MLEPLKRYGINPKTRSRDGFAVKLQPLASCDQPAIADVLANSTLRGPQADTLLLVDIPSTPLKMHLFLRFTSTQPGSIRPSPCGPILNATVPPQLQHRPLTSQPLYPVREDILNVQADGRLAAHLRETPALQILEEDAEPNEDLAGDDFTYSQETTTTFQELLTLIDSNTKELPSVLSPSHWAALTQLPLTLTRGHAL